MRQLALAAPLAGAATLAIVVLGAADADRGALALAAAIAVVAGLAATSIGVFGAILVPGLLLLGLEPVVAAPLSLLLQVLVIPLGAGTHATVGHVRRGIAGPLVVGGAAGGVGGALVASSVPPEVAARAVAVVIVAVGLIVLANLRSTLAAEPDAGRQPGPGSPRVGAIGAAAGFASGLSGAGWGPIGVKLLVLAGVDPRVAVGSSLVGRLAMALASIGAYGLTAAASGALRVDPALLAVLFAGSAGAIVPGTYVIGRLGRRPAAVAIAVTSIALALPTVFGWTA